MKKILLFASALAGLFLAGSCQKETFEPAATGVTYEISLPELVQTKADNKHEYAEYDLYYEVYKTVSVADLADPKTKPLFENMVTMTGNSRTLSLDLLNDQDYTILFWANKKDNYSFNLDDLRNVGVKEAASNNDDRDAFCGKDQISQHDAAYSKTVELKRPFAQVNIATVVKSVAEIGYDITPISSLVKFTKIPTAYNVLDDMPVGANAEVTYGVNWVPEGNLDATEYKKVAMNYVLVPEGTVDVYYEINTPNGTVKNTVGNVPVKKNYRTNIIGNLLTSNATYTIELKPGFDSPDENVAVQSVSTAEELAEAIAGVASAESESTNIKFEGDINLDDLLGLTRAANDNQTLTIPAGKVVTLDLNGYFLYAFDSTEKNYSVIDNRGTLTITNSNKSKTSKISVKADVNSGWSRYSAVLANNPGGKLTVCAGVELEHLGGTDMAYGIDNLTNGKGTYAVTVIDGATVKSPYRAVRQFLNGPEATNELYVNAGSVLEGANKSIFFHDPSTGANTGKLVVDAEAQLKGDVYLFVTAGSTEWPVDVTIAKTALVGESEVIPGNVPEGYSVIEKDGVYTVSHDYDVVDGVMQILNANGLKVFAEMVNGGNTFARMTVALAADLDLNNEEWAPIGTSAHPFKGTFDGNGMTIRNLVVNGGQSSNQGLFGYTTDGEIKNLTIENAKVSGRLNVGVVAGTPYTSKYSNITVQGHVEVNGMAYVGGVAGKNAYADWTNVTVNVDKTSYVNANSIENGTAYRTYVGGVVGFNGEGGHSFKNITSNIDVKGSTIDVGGLFGIAHYSNKFENCVCSGNVEIYRAEEAADADEIGGIAGVWHNENGTTVSFTNCSFTGTLKTNVEGVYLSDNTIVGAPYNATGTGVLYIDDAATVVVSTASDLTEKLQNGYSVILTEDIDYGTTQLAIQGQNQVVNLGGHKLTTNMSYGGMALKNGASIVNGTIEHTSTVAAIKAFNVGSIENVTIKTTCATANKTITAIAVQQGGYVGSIKNVTIEGVSQGIEVGYQATVDLIEGVTVEEQTNGTANGIALVINGGKVGLAKNSTFKGDAYGVTMHLKGVFAVGLELENCVVEGTTASIYAWDEKGISNTSGSLSLTYDAATNLVGPFVWDFEEECQSVVTLNRPE